MEKPEEEQETEPQKLGFFRRLVQIPCYKESLLTGFQVALASSLGWMLATSNGKAAGKVGISLLTVATLGNWTYCRYNYNKTLESAKEIDEIFDKINLYKKLEVTEEDDVSKPTDNSDQKL